MGYYWRGVFSSFFPKIHRWRRNMGTLGDALSMACIWVFSVDHNFFYGTTTSYQCVLALVVLLAFCVTPLCACKLSLCQQHHMNHLTQAHFKASITQRNCWLLLTSAVRNLKLSFLAFHCYKNDFSEVFFFQRRLYLKPFCRGLQEILGSQQSDYLQKYVFLEVVGNTSHH